MHAQIDLLQLQQRRTAQFVAPLHTAAADEPFRLREHPVGPTAVAVLLLRDLDTGDEDAAVGRTPHVQLGPLDRQLLEPEVPE